MRYGDLIQFEPLESVIQLLDANRPQEADKLVSTYVISDDMAARIARLIIPQLGFDAAVDHKGVLIVGDYGSGKSHLMAVLSLAAEDARYAALLRHPQVAAAAAVIAGKFKVHRSEISSRMALRDIVTGELEGFLSRHGVDFSFPPADQVVNNKAAFEEMMAAFAAVYPDQGVLLVVDEFLEYLRSRKDHELVLDLSFLRELGEIAKHLRFRFVAGVQEAIFDSSRFEHVASSLRRVKDRFTQVLLARQDVSFVIAERLLKKSVDQQEKIRAYLTPFARFYGAMNERMDEYVRLFPVHPDYLATFERIGFAEKRNTLETLSLTMRPLLEREAPADRPGLIAYDDYWKTVQGNPAFRSDPAIKEIIRVSDVLEARVRQAFTRPAYQPLALRIIQALSVHRLTTGGDVYVLIGPTAEELRDSLCLYQPGIEDMGGEPAADLLSLTQTVLREIMKTVNGQFISKARDTEQYYLDLKKDIDYDAQIERRAETLSNDALDRAYYSAVKQLMERADETSYVTGHSIWQYPLEWQERRVERNGYLFFGAPNDRPTAQPDRDFYIYFIQPFDPPRFHDQHLADEVFFRLKGLDDDIRRQLAFYAAALEQASVASGQAKKIYLDKSQDALRAISQWLQKNQLTAFEVTCQGRTKTLQNWVKGISLRDKARLGPEERINFREVVNIVTGLALGPRFAETAPEYPSFAVLVTEANRGRLIVSALRALAGGLRGKDANAILDALELLDGDRIEPSRSRYAQEILNRLQAKGHGQVLNRAEVIEGPTDVEYFAPDRFRLEPDLLAVVLAALVYSGDLVLAITGDKIDSGKLSRLAECSLDELEQFKHIEAPKEINVAVLRALFELLDPQAPSGLAQQAAQGSDEPVKRLREAVTQLVGRVLAAGADLQGRLTFWGQSLLRDEELRDWRARLEALKSFTESLSPYNTVGKLKNLRVGLEDIEAQQRNLAALTSVEAMLKLVADLGGAAAYLSQAEMALPGDHPWVKQAQTARRTMLDQLSQDRVGRQAAEHRRTLAQLKKSYIAAYIAEHGKARLGVAEDRTKAALGKDARLRSLQVLAGVSMMPTGQLEAFQNRLDNLKSCYQLSNPELNVSPICPHCGYKPANESLPFGPAANALTQLDGELDRLLAAWRRTLLDNLAEPDIRAKFELLRPAARDLIESFVASKTLPDPVTPEFVGTVQEAFSGLEKITVAGTDIRQALLAGGSPATPEELLRRFQMLLDERCKGKDMSKLRFIIE